MFSRVLKSTTAQGNPPAPPLNNKEPPTTPSKSRSGHGHTKSQSAVVAPSPSRIPVPTTPSSRSNMTGRDGYAKENVRYPRAVALCSLLLAHCSDRPSPSFATWRAIQLPLLPLPPSSTTILHPIYACQGEQGCPTSYPP